MPSKKTEKSLTHKKAAKVTSKKTEKSLTREKQERKSESQLEKLAINQRFRDRDSEIQTARNWRHKEKNLKKLKKMKKRALRRLTLSYGARGRLIRKITEFLKEIRQELGTQQFFTFNKKFSSASAG